MAKTVHCPICRCWYIDPKDRCEHITYKGDIRPAYLVMAAAVAEGEAKFFAQASIVLQNSNLPGMRSFRKRK